MNKSYLPILTPIIIFLVGIGFLFYTYYKNISNKPSALSVTSKYGDAQVTFRGQNLGDTPIEATELKPGRGELVIKSSKNTIKKEVILTQEALTVVSVDSGVSNEFSGNLVIWYDKNSKEEPEVFVTSNPDQAEVKVNDKFIGETPLTISESQIKSTDGNYTILIEKEGYESQKLTIKLEKDYILNISSSLFLKPLPQEVKKVSDTDSYVVYGLNNQFISDSKNANWPSAISYWLETRGSAVFGGENISYFDFFVDSEGTFYNGKGDVIDASTVKIENTPEKPILIGYLNAQDNELTDKAKDILAKITGLAVVASTGENEYEIIETGLGYLNVRKEPSVNGQLLGTINVGEKIKVIEQQTDWSKIKFKDSDAWVSSAYLRKVVAAEEAEDTEENEE